MSDAWGDPRIWIAGAGVLLSAGNVVLAWLYKDHDVKQAVQRHEQRLNEINEKRSDDMSLVTGKIGTLELDVREAQVRLDAHQRELDTLQRDRR